MRSIVENVMYHLNQRATRSRVIGPYRFHYSNREEFGRIYYEVFTDSGYRFESATNSPRILDCGSHIGLSVLYFKLLYPNAKVIAFEPNPDVFPILQANILDNGLTDVELIHAAVTDQDGTVPFIVNRDGVRNWTWGGSVVPHAWHDPARNRIERVPAVRLAPYIGDGVDLLKLDIEGLETAVLTDAGAALSRVEEIILEFHGSSANPRNDLNELLQVLARYGFTSRIDQASVTVTPDEVERTDPFWLNIYAKRA
ncbi:MAG: FkbM family methyltransferase [Chloroflexia bacterium]|nr:FkbM family methyltransferase [Chloroflexia bacterium]